MQLEALRRLTKKDVIQCFVNHVKNGEKYKKLSVQVQ
jgi:hypothetical protein